MNLIVIVDPDYDRRAALQRAFVEPDIEVAGCDNLTQVRGLTKGRHIAALLPAWFGGRERIKAPTSVEWSADYVAPMLMLPGAVTPEQVEAESQHAGSWSKQVFPQARVKCMTRLNGGEIKRLLADIREEEGPKIPDQEPRREEPIDEDRAAQILGNRVQILRSLGSGATCSVFLVKTALGEVRAYKLGRTSRVRQLEAVKKAVGLIFDTAEGSSHLLLAAVNYCHDDKYFVIASALLDDANGARSDFNLYRPKTLSCWLKLQPRCNGALDKHAAFELLVFLASVLNGLSFLHRNGLVFNDVHGENCGFFSKRPVWIDYSAITFIGDPPFEGCCFYAAPEGREATPAHDCFSIVKLLVEALSGLHPADIQPTKIEGISSKYFEGSLAVVKKIACKGLAMDPGERYRSASELARDLSHARRVLRASLSVR